jgi:hypothetical protein
MDILLGAGRMTASAPAGSRVPMSAVNLFDPGFAGGVLGGESAF